MKKLRYCPAFNKLTGGINATLLMLQIEYWFEKTNGNKFFKFLEPCEDGCYKSGDSWCEELGFSKDEFRTAFRKIGKAYKSKKAFDESLDKFEGKMYLSYFDRIKRLTFYMRNDTLVDGYLELERWEESISRSGEETLPISLDYDIDFPVDKEHSVPCEEIVQAYHEECEELPKVKSLSKKLREKIYNIWRMVKGDIGSILEVIQKVKQSDFLSGRIPGKFWRASLDWIMQEDKFRAILAGKYGMNDQTRRKKKEPKKFQKMLTHEWDFNQLEVMENQYIEEKIESYKNLTSPLLSKLREERLRRN